MTEISDIQLIWLAVEDYSTPINKGDSFTLEVIELDRQNQQFMIRRISPDPTKVRYYTTPLPFGVYNVVIKITSDKASYKIKKDRLNIPEDFIGLPEA